MPETTTAQNDHVRAQSAPSGHTEAVSGAHRVEWTLQTGGYVTAELVCTHTAPAPCRMVCPHGCEDNPCEPDHVFVDSGYCNPKEWIDAAEVEESYLGPTQPVRDDDIEFEWEGDGYSWHYAVEEASRG